MSLKQDVIEFIQEYASINNGRGPIKQVMLESVPGLHNSKFYQLFKGVKDAQTQAGIVKEKPPINEPEEDRINAQRTVKQVEKPDPRNVQEQISAVMMMLGEQDPKRAMTRACKIISEYTRFAFLNNFEDPTKIHTILSEQLQESDELVSKYTDLSTEELLSMAGITDETLYLIEYTRRVSKIPLNTDCLESGIINILIKSFFEGPPHFIRVVGTPILLAGQEPIMRVKRMSQKEINNWYDQYG